MEEKKLVVCRKHWITFVGPILIGVMCLIAGFIGMLYGTKNFGLAVMIFIVGIGIFTRAYFSYKTTYIILTDKRVIVRQGIIFPHVHSIPRIHIQGFEREYTVLGIVFGYRTIKISCWGEDEPDVNFKYMTRANEFASELTGQTDEGMKHLK